MKAPELMMAFGTVGRVLPGRYDRLERVLAEQPVEIQHEFHRLIQSFDTELSQAKRRAREPWRGR
jgi:hypothetical protein